MAMSRTLKDARAKLRKVPDPSARIELDDKYKNMGNTTPADKEFVLDGKTKSFQYNFSWIKGRRPTMEDQHIAKQLESDNTIEIFGILDGHGGEVVSNKISETFPAILRDEIKNSSDSETIEDIIKNSFGKADRNLLKILLPEQTSVGSTCAVVVRIEDNVYCAHVGDSCIFVLDKDDDLIYRSKDHKVTDPEEAMRIEKAGGKIFCGRISQNKSFGGLAVSRSFGDFQFKEIHDSDSNPNSVSVIPDIVKIDSSIIGCAIIMCDGITDILKDEDILTLVTEDKSQLAHKLVFNAYDGGSLDNISAAVILPLEK